MPREDVEEKREGFGNHSGEELALERQNLLSNLAPFCGEVSLLPVAWVSHSSVTLYLKLYTFLRKRLGRSFELSLPNFFSQGFRKEEKTTKGYLHQLTQLINPIFTG